MACPCSPAASRATCRTAWTGTSVRGGSETHYSGQGPIHTLLPSNAFAGPAWRAETAPQQCPGLRHGEREDTRQLPARASPRPLSRSPLPPRTAVANANDEDVQVFKAAVVLVRVGVHLLAGEGAQAGKLGRLGAPVVAGAHHDQVKDLGDRRLLAHLRPVKACVCVRVRGAFECAGRSSAWGIRVRGAFECAGRSRRKG